MNKINLIIGDNFLDVNKKTLEKVDIKDLNKKNIIIVPDRFSLICEKQIFDVLKTEVVFNVEVMGITKFANSLFEKMQLDVEYVTKQESLMLMHLAIKNVKKCLKCFVGDTTKSISEEILHTIIQLKSNNIFPEQLQDTNQKGIIEDKLHDIKLIYEEYNKLLAGRLDATSVIEKLKNNIQQVDLSNYNIFFVNFDSFSSHWYSLLQVLIPKVNSIYIGAVKSNLASNSYVYEEDLFNKIMLLAENNNFVINTESVENSLNKFQNAIHNNLFSASIISEKNMQKCVSVFECENKTKEIESVAKIIKQKIVNENLKFNEIQIAVGDLQNYSEEIKKVFKEYGFSFFVDESRKLYELETIKFLVNYLKLLSENYEKIDVEKFLFSPLCTLEREDKLSIFESIFQNDNFENFLSNEILVDKTDIYKNIYFEKNKIYKIKEIIEKIKLIINNIKLIEKNNELINYFQINNNLLNQKMYIQIENKIESVLQSIEKIIGNEEYTLTSFIDIFIYFLENTNLSIVPIGVDSIFIGDATASYFEEKKLLIVLGANENLLPKYLSDNLILDDETIDSLKNCFEISPSIKLINKRNKFKLFNLLILAKEMLIVTYSLSDNGNEKLIPSGFVKDVCQIFEIQKTSFENYFKYSLENDNEDVQVKKLCEYFGVKTAIYDNINNIVSKHISFNVLATLKNYIDDLRTNIDYTIPNSEGLMIKNNSISVSQIESYMACPFQHFANYGLKLQENFDCLITPADIGNYLHEVVEKFLLPQNNYIKKIQNKTEKIENIINKICFSIENKENNKKLKLKCNKISLNILRAETIELCNYLYENVLNSNFKPVYIEMKFGKNDNSKDNKQNLEYVLKVDNKDFYISGKVDRVDACGDMLRILDYKSGSVKNASYGELFYGEKIQVFLYAKVLTEILKKTVYGVYYFPMRSISSNEKKKAYELFGKSVDDEKYLLFANETPDKISRVIFDNMCDYALGLTQKVLKEILNAEIKPNPLKESCKYCPFMSLCGKHFEEARQKQTITKKFFDDEVKE